MLNCAGRPFDFMMHRVFFTFLCFLLALCRVSSQSITKRQFSFFFSCLQHRNDLQWIRTLPTRGQTDMCLSYLDDVRRTAETGGAAASAISRPTSGTIYSYISALTMWRNEEGSLHHLLLDSVSPCHVLSRRLKKTWRKFFMRRLNTYAIVPMIYEQTWSFSTGSITVRPSRARCKSKQLVAAELVLRRKRPLEIHEAFGSYAIDAAIKLGRTKTVTVHSSHQSSCSPRDGRFIVLDLQTERFSHWHRRKASNLTITVSVRPLKQYFSPPRNVTVDVVEEIVGLVLHFRRCRHHRSLPDDDVHLETAVRSVPLSTFRNPPRSVHGDRNKRNVRRPTATQTGLKLRSRRSQSRPCHLIQFRVSNGPQQLFNVSWPENGNPFWDIKECAGSCSRPIPAHVNKTNHTLLINTEEIGQVCCVPVRHKSIYYITQMEGELRGNPLEQTVAVECGCR